MPAIVHNFPLQHHTTLIKLLDFILSQVYYGVVSDNSIKKMCEKLSWVTPDSVSYWED